MTDSTLIIITPVDDAIIARDMTPDAASVFVRAYVTHHDLHDVDFHYVDNVNGDRYTYDFSAHPDNIGGWLVL